MDGACWVCFCCQHSPVQDMNARIFWVCAMEYMCAQNRPRFIVSSERIVRNRVRIHVNSKRKNPLYQMPPKRVEPMMLHHVGQQAQNTTDWAILAPVTIIIIINLIYIVQFDTNGILTALYIVPVICTWCYRVRGRTDWPAVSILGLGETASLICSFCLSVSASATG